MSLLPTRFRRLRLKYWGQKGQQSDVNPDTFYNLLADGTRNVDTTNPSVEILLVRDDTPSLYYDEDELRVQRIVEMATNNILSEKVMPFVSQDSSYLLRSRLRRRF